MGITEVIIIFAMIATNLATVIALYVNLDKKLEEQRKDTLVILQAIQEEVKSIHSRLCKIEERNKK